MDLSLISRQRLMTRAMSGGRNAAKAGACFLAILSQDKATFFKTVSDTRRAVNRTRTVSGPSTYSPGPELRPRHASLPTRRFGIRGVPQPNSLRGWRKQGPRKGREKIFQGRRMPVKYQKPPFESVNTKNGKTLFSMASFRISSSVWG